MFDMAPDQVIVLYQQYFFIAFTGVVQVRIRRGPAVVLVGAGQVQLDGSAVTRLRIDTCMSVGLPGKTVNHCQTQAASPALSFGRIEWVKGMRDSIGIHPHSGVGYGNLHILTRSDIMHISIVVVHCHVGSLDGQQAAIRHGIPGVDGKVQDGVFQL